jgi:hypothetical protein
MTLRTFAALALLGALAPALAAALTIEDGLKPTRPRPSAAATTAPAGCASTCPTAS